MRAPLLTLALFAAGCAPVRGDLEVPLPARSEGRPSDAITSQEQATAAVVVDSNPAPAGQVDMNQSSTRTLPPLDLRRPLHTEIATFALG